MVAASSEGPAPVAVIVAAYNAESVLDAALASVLAQTVAPAEVVVVDDHSSDGTGAVAAAWSDRLPVTVVRSGSNVGPSGARRLAIEHASSPLIAVLDADDAWLPDHLQAMVGAHRDEATLVSADPMYWVTGEEPGPAWSERMPLPASDQLAALYRENYVFSGTLYARALYDRVGGYRPQFRVGEDWDLWLRMVRSGAVVVRPDHPTVLYRVSAGSMTVSASAGPDRVAVLELAVREAADDAERRIARRAARRVRADGQLLAAYEAAASHPWVARAHGARALTGHRRVVVRGLAMIASPRRVTARRDAVRSDPRSRFTA